MLDSIPQTWRNTVHGSARMMIANLDPSCVERACTMTIEVAFLALVTVASSCICHLVDQPEVCLCKCLNIAPQISASHVGPYLAAAHGTSAGGVCNMRRKSSAVAMRLNHSASH